MIEGKEIFVCDCISSILFFSFSFLFTFDTI